MGELSKKLLKSIGGPKPWDALEHLPHAITVDKRAATPWNDAALEDYVIAWACINALTLKLQDEEVPVDLTGADQRLFTDCGYSQKFSIPRMIASQQLRDAAVRLSMFFPHFYKSYDGGPALIDFESLNAVRGDFSGLVNIGAAKLLLFTDVSWQDKVAFLQDSTVALTIVLSWYFIRVAVERWPSSLEGSLAWEMFTRICVSMQSVMNKPNFLSTTDRETWSKVSRIAGDF